MQKNSKAIHGDSSYKGKYNSLLVKCGLYQYISFPEYDMEKEKGEEGNFTSEKSDKQQLKPSTQG